MEKLVLKFKNGKFVGIDTGSGGYPYPTDVFRAESWNSEEEALKYASKFDFIEYKIYRITTSIN